MTLGAIGPRVSAAKFPLASKHTLSKVGHVINLKSFRYYVYAPRTRNQQDYVQPQVAPMCGCGGVAYAVSAVTRIGGTTVVRRGRYFVRMMGGAEPDVSALQKQCPNDVTTIMSWKYG